MAFLCIDPGIRGGWAVVANTAPPVVLAHGKSPARKGTGRSGHDLGALLELVERWQPTVAIMETPQHVRIGGALNATATAGLRASADLWRAACEARGVEVHHIAPATWQAAWSIKRGAWTTKAQASSIVARLFPALANVSDGANDAILIGIFGARSLNLPRE